MKTMEVIEILSEILREHECNSSYIDFEYEEDTDKAQEWIRKRDALETAIDKLYKTIPVKKRTRR